MEPTELILLYDYYGELLTPRQRQCFELRYHQDLSLGEIAQELNVSRQGVYDNLSRADALLQNMEAKTGLRPPGAPVPPGGRSASVRKRTGC